MRNTSESPYQDISPLSSDAESEDDPVIRNARDSTETARHDITLLEEEEEREKLISNHREKPDAQGLSTRKPRAGKGERKAYRTGNRRKRKHEGLGENGQLMYEMEEGGPQSETSSQASLSSVELDKMNSHIRHASRVSIHRHQKA